MLYVTSDLHRDIAFIKDFLITHQTNKDDIMFVTGDAQINYFENDEDKALKEELNALPITFVFIQGNKEKRPRRISSYQITSYLGNKVYVEKEYPSLLFAIDGEIYYFENKSFFILGGAYSIYAPGKKDGELWWNDEEMNEYDKRHALKNIKENRYVVDYVLSHTAPLKYNPPEIDYGEHKISEIFLQEIEEKITYKGWYLGHFHINRDFEKIHILYKTIQEIK